MVKFKYLLLVLAAFSIIVYYGCDDAGNVIVLNPKGTIGFSQTNLQTLSSGNFELWLALDTNAVRTWYSLGRFNINSAGQMVDLSGNAMSFKYNGDTNRLGLSTVALVTYETDSDPNPSPYGIMSGTLTIGDTIRGDLLISGSDALGGLGATLLNSPNYIGDYVLSSPTTNQAQCFKGLWFCDSVGASHFIPGLDLPGGSHWKYEGWVVDVQNTIYYSTGKFTSFNSADQDGPGTATCNGPNPPFNKPGQEFVTGCSGANLNNGNFGVFITLQPEVLSGTPFFIKLFLRDVIQTLQCGERDVYFRSLGYEGKLPSAHITIAN